MRYTLYVGGLPPKVDLNSVRSLFSDFGEIRDARLATRGNGDCRGFAFVTFANGLDAARARVALNGRALEGTTLRVAVAR